MIAALSMLAITGVFFMFFMYLFMVIIIVIFCDLRVSVWRKGSMLHVAEVKHIFIILILFLTSCVHVHASCLLYEGKYIHRTSFSAVEVRWYACSGSVCVQFYAAKGRSSCSIPGANLSFFIHPSSFSF